ncbi:uncharacterized protein N7473_011020 [Penicillium subrubescens]|uniref:DUF2423 domain-containing protein n=1 Tax=Penicillium subrubescens TaxID=1316194 RepID=A0A1Q5TED5_9EURO|nr:uncharacterized protein N7473_011020 [Penicillium subrubescens]KAJ5884134.1 hypothetical protein N7473_011020 [Penicillium subrubescens]OKO98570.1 hypothetical protein PENSUB_9246 [Penicillium subrubescens]
MAKSVRASVSKRNRANLRKTVFGPIVDARTERLAAKLQEIASQPKPEAPKKKEMDIEADETADQNDAEKATPVGEEMDIDNKSTKTRSAKSGRVQKQPRNRKTRPSIVFSKPVSKNKKGGPKRK